MFFLMEICYYYYDYYYEIKTLFCNNDRNKITDFNDNNRFLLIH